MSGVLIFGDNPLAVALFERFSTAQAQFEHELMVAHEGTGRYAPEIRIPPDTMRHVMDAMAQYEPLVVINCADYNPAIVNDPKGLMQVNTIGAANIALGARGVGAFLMHLSTDLVFGGGGYSGPYRYTNRPFPLQTYGQSRYWGELVVHSLSEQGRYMIIRLPSLYGQGVTSQAKAVREASGDLRPKTVRYRPDGTLQPDRPTAWSNALGTPAYIGHVVDRIYYHILAYGYFRDLTLNTLSRSAHIQHCAPAEEPISWYSFLSPFFDVDPISAPPRPGVPAIGGLVPTVGWELPSYWQGMQDFLGEPEASSEGSGEGPR